LSAAPNPSTILITGATGAIGGALAEIYARPGITLILQGRNAGRLAELEGICQAKGAKVALGVKDVRELDSYLAWLDEVCGYQAIDLLFVNAGVNMNIGANGEGESWEETRELIEVNVLAALATVNRVLPSMRARKKGQIALMSSLAAYFGLPVTPSYCASKAAIKTYGEALRGWLAPEGIGVSVVMPGYVESQMCHNMPGPKPFLWPADRAARYIKTELTTNRPRISFPFPLNLGTWLLSVLPPALSERILRQLHYGG
jgi:short-subunit dehydrogenase